MRKTMIKMKATNNQFIYQRQVLRMLRCDLRSCKMTLASNCPLSVSTRKSMVERVAQLRRMIAVNKLELIQCGVPTLFWEKKKRKKKDFKMNVFVIVGYVAIFALALIVLANVLFWLFVQAFGILDGMIQKGGYTFHGCIGEAPKMPEVWKDSNGDEWTISSCEDWLLHDLRVRWYLLGDSVQTLPPYEGIPLPPQRTRT